MRYTDTEVMTMPKFQKNFPKNAAGFLDPASDEAFKKKHPIGYWVLIACGIGGLVLPLAILILVTSVIFPAPNSGFLMLAMAGCFIIGIGIFNIIAAWIGQYLGHWVTIGSFLVGGLLVAVSLTIIYVPDIYALFDEAVVSFYFMTLLFLLPPPIFYLMFRHAVHEWLRRRKISKSRIEKMKKGKRNYWWYQALHEEFDLGLLYHLNKLQTIVYPVTAVLGLLFGWLRCMMPVVSGLYAVVSLLGAAMSLFSSVQMNLEEHGVPFVILAQRKNKGFDSIVFDLILAGFPLMAGYAHIMTMLETVFPQRMV